MKTTPQSLGAPAGKRLLDFAVATTGLLVLSPLLGAVALAIWLQDRRFPFYLAPRVARGNTMFTMVKFRSMTVGADRSGVASTAADDMRISPIGRFVRRFKLDELPQLWNILKGEMSLVGPRPQVRPDVDIFTNVERVLLTVRPGITDLSSIVFSDEGEILRGVTNPDLVYNQLIRPWKSRLGLLYVSNQSLRLDIEIIALTLTALASRRVALAGVQRILQRLRADALMLRTARREQVLEPFPPPGASDVVTER